MTGEKDRPKNRVKITCIFLSREQCKLTVVGEGEKAAAATTVEARIRVVVFMLMCRCLLFMYVLCKYVCGKR